MEHNIPPLDAEALAGAAAAHHVQRHDQDGVAILTLAGPDGNRLDPELTAQLARALDAALADGAVRAVVLTARGPDFCAGPWRDLPPPGPQPVDPPAILADVAALCRRLEASPKPVVCALHGRVASGGLALALAARARLADPRATLHFPEIRLGRLPPGNAAVRLAWWLGAAEALRLLLARAPLPVSAFAAQGLCELAAEGGAGLVPQAAALAARLADDAPGTFGPGTSGAPSEAPPQPGLADAAGFRAAIVRARHALPAPLPRHRAHERLLIEAVEAAQLLPPDQALAFDLVRAQDAAQAPEARALAHLARATRRALDTPEARAVPRAPRLSPLAAALDPETAARLMPPLLRSGARVVMLSPARDPLAAALEAVAEAQMAQIRKGALSAAQAEEDWSRISGRLSLEGAGFAPGFALADAGHAAWLDAQLPAATARAVWGPATPPPAPADGARAGALLVPAPSRAPRLCEVVVTEGCDAETVQQATQLALRLKLSPVRAHRAPLAPALAEALASATTALRARGVAPAELAATGLLPPDLAELVEDDAASGPPAADTDARADLPLSAERLVLLAAINAGMRLLAEGRALRPSDLDLVAVLGLGWPNWRGGPMAEADALGPIVLRHELRAAAALAPELWAPHPMLDEMIHAGRRFDDLNAAPV